MKRLLFLFVISFYSLLCYAQTNTARVILKNGTTYTGQVSELNPQSHITLIIAGIKTRINIRDIESIEDVSEQSTTTDSLPISSTAVKMEPVLPENYLIEIGPYIIKMVLVKGSVFSMGYDGRGSQSLQSEPVHNVALCDFYVNSAPLEKELVDYFVGEKKISGKSGGFYRPSSRIDAERIASLIAHSANLPTKLITEAQWEYLATNKTPIFIFHYFENEQNYCLDSYREYSFTKEPQLDPCPKGGSLYVFRQFALNSSDRIYKRYVINAQTKISNEAVIRITFPASALSN